MQTDQTQIVFSDGGRRQSGFKGDAGDCVCRAVAIASGIPYSEVYAVLAKGNANQRTTKCTRKRAKGFKKETADHGISVKRKWFQDYMKSIGFSWIPTMKIGQGCKVHLRADELPAGRLVVSLSKHYCAVIDGVIHDTHDPTRDGTRCVYGYFILNAQNK